MGVRDVYTIDVSFGMCAIFALERGRDTPMATEVATPKEKLFRYSNYDYHICDVLFSNTITLVE